MPIKHKKKTNGMYKHDCAMHPRDTDSGVSQHDDAVHHPPPNDDCDGESESITIRQRYELGSCLGKGSFGRIYRMHDQLTGLDVAAKLEHTSSKHPQVVYESKIYDAVMGHANIPNVHTSFQEGEYNILVMDMLGASLEDLIKERPGGAFSLRTVLLLARQLINVLQHLHEKDFIHRDIKPENFLMGTQHTSSIVYLIDMGLVKRYRQHDQHIFKKTNKSLVGTVRYASVDTHRGIEQSRKDDMESLGYMLVYLLKGSLPWQNMHGDTLSQKYEKIHRVKTSTSLDALCADVPGAFCEYLRMCREMAFDERPDYDGMRHLFNKLMEENGFSYDDHDYDWS